MFEGRASTAAIQINKEYWKLGLYLIGILEFRNLMLTSIALVAYLRQQNQELTTALWRTISSVEMIHKYRAPAGAYHLLPGQILTLSVNPVLCSLLGFNAVFASKFSLTSLTLYLSPCTPLVRISTLQLMSAWTFRPSLGRLKVIVFLHVFNYRTNIISLVSFQL